MIEGQALTGIASQVVFFPSRSGKKIVGFLDIAAGCSETAPYVVMAPKYGQSKKNNLQLAYHFAQNGMRVLRFDQTNHIGESEGEIVDYTLPGAVDDILAAVDFLEIQYQAQSILLQANSMSARCAIRAVRLDERIERLVCLVGIVNFQSTITTICQKDIVSAYMDGAIQGVGDILGHDVNIDQFLKTCVDQDMHNLDGSMTDLREAKCDVFMFAAGRDAWVESSELDALDAQAPRVSMRRVEGAMHELMENPKIAMDTILQAVYVCKHGRFAEAGELETLSFPDKKSIFAQNRIERDRLRAVAPLRECEGDFWKKYLDKYKMLQSVGAYQEYLDLIGACLGAPRAGQVYLDCGCGNGMFGAWCLRDSAVRAGVNQAEPVSYFGLDLTGKGLSEASQNHSIATKELGDASFGGLNMMYYRFDLDELDPGSEAGLRLPFEDASIDRICCSLLISYLKRPEVLISEFHRILKPGGRIIVSSMKPYCDLSLIYKGFVDEADTEDAIESARNLLSAAGAIQQKEEEGHYVFYTEEELLSVLTSSGFDRAQFFRSFGDQANLVSAVR